MLWRPIGGIFLSGVVFLSLAGCADDHRYSRAMRQGAVGPHSHRYVDPTLSNPFAYFEEPEAFDQPIFNGAAYLGSTIAWGVYGGDLRNRYIYEPIPYLNATRAAVAGPSAPHDLWLILGGRTYTRTYYPISRQAADAASKKHQLVRRRSAKCPPIILTSRRPPHS